MASRTNDLALDADGHLYEWYRRQVTGRRRMTDQQIADLRSRISKGAAGAEARRERDDDPTPR